MLRNRRGIAVGSAKRKSSCFSFSENVPFQNRCAESAGSNEPCRKRLSLYSKLIRSSEAGIRSAQANAARRRGAGIARLQAEYLSARYVRYPANNSSDPSPLRATVACCRVILARNHVGSAPASALGSSE